MNPGVQETLIWAAVVLILLLPTLRFLARPVLRAISAWTEQHTVSSGERDVAIQLQLTGVEERRDQLALKQATLAERTASERARLAAETAQYDTDARAATATIDAATEARKQVLAARAQAEAELAPEFAKVNASSGRTEDLQALSQAYMSYCREIDYPASFGDWIGNLEGWPR